MFDRKNVQDLYRLSPLQQGMLFHYLNDPRSTAYFEQTSFQLTGKVDQHLLEESFQHLVNQYEMLRTVFLYEHVTKPMQVVLKERKVRLYFQDLSWLGQEEQQQYIEKFLTEQREKGFDLSKDQLFQLALFQYSHDRFELIIQFHHILMDGWCLGILLNDLLENYERKKEGLPFLQKHVPRYSQYIRWLAEQDEEKGQRFWQQYLDGFEQTITIPEEKSIDQPYQLGVKKYVCSKAMTEQLNQYARKLQVTLNSVVQVLWALLLQKYNLTDDVLYGMVVSGRPPTISGVEKMVGLFINTVPCRVQSQGDESIQQLIQRIQQELLETEPYHHLSLADLLPNQEMIRHLIAFENYPFDESMLSRELGFQITDVHGFEQTHYDFNLVVAAGEQLAFTFRYNRSVYSTSTVDRIWNHLQFIMEQLINQQDMKVKDLSLVTPEEIHQLESWNQTESDFPAHQTIHELFALQVNKRPRHIAVIDGNKEITYAQLNQRANRLAYLLQKQGVKGETIVGVLARPSIDWVVGILAILKAGGAYLPIDPAYPADRIAYMLKDSSARLLLCQEGFGPPKQYDGKHLIIDEEGVEKELTDINGDAKNLAYVIYTSGSTGLPKGVMVEHRSLINLAYWHQQQYQLTEQDCCSKYAGLGFDASAWELFPTLLSGASLIIVPDELRHDPMALSQFFEQHGVTISFLPTQMAEQFMQVGNQSLRFLLTGGEELQQVSKTSYTLVNHYGPTENTVVATATSITTETKPISIGRPIANNRVYLLDHHQQLQSVGLPGELWIGGDSLARGYLHRAELTAKRFMDWNGERLYRTGDLARWLPDGRLEFLGRVDDQIQLRGYRIELGEIEGQLYQHPLVTQAIVLVHGKRTSQQRLIAYVVLKQPQVIQADQLHAFLKKQLPSYMLPAQIVELDQLPITANGKVDRQKLLSFAISKETALYEAPRNRTEDRLVDLWEEVLEVPRVGIHDHFYALGGHSLKAILLRARIQKEFGVHISIREIFDRPTVAALATYIDEAEKEGAVSFEQLPEQAYYPVSSAQKRMYILQKFENVGVGYNIPLVFSLDGQLNLARLKAGIQQLIQRHEVLRTSFQMIDDEVLQKVHADATLEIKQVKANTEEEARKYVEQWIQPFDLYQVPQIRAGLVELATNRSILLIDVPHIIADGVSINCLIQELIICYQDGDLKPLPYQYKEFAYWQQQWLKTKQAKQQQAYWLDQLSGELPKLELPTDYPRPTEQQFTGDIYQWSLPDELTKKLNQLAQDEKSSLYMVLMAAYSVWLMKMSGQQDVLIGTPFAGRTHADITQMLGMFVNTLPIRLKPDPTFTFRQLIHQVKEQLFAAYEAGDYPLEEVIAQLPLQRDPSRNPLFDTMFILQNHQQTQLTLPDVDIAPFPMQATTAKFDLTWTVIERDQLEMTIEYATHLFHSRSISSMADSFTHLLEQLMVHDTRLIKEISLLTKDQKAMQLAQAGQLVPYPAEKTLHQLFEEQAQRTPDAIAVIVEDQQLSYQELDQRSTQLGCLLRDQGVSRDSIVALQMQKSIEMIVGILAILKAGGAYLPIEPTYPKERVEYLLEDSEAALLLTTSSVEQSVAYTGKILCIDDPKLYTGNHVELPLINQSSDLAYLLYTSGSTGKPKGVMVEHRHVTRLWLYEGNQWQIQQTDRWAMFHSFCFDVSVGEIFGALLHGAALVLVTSEVARHPQQLRDLLAQEQVTILCQTPSAFIPLQAIEEDQTKHDLSLRRIIFAGEALAPAQLKAWRKWYPNTELLNMYGPTEAAIYATVKQIDDQLITSNRSNIGKPLPTMRAYVLDEHQQFVPTGVIGELYLSGAGVTRGYWKQPQLTADRFLPDPFLPDTQMYRTGDRVRWLNSGELEYMGRIDDQVKIRGHRIELGEITTHLLTHPSVKDAAVIVHQGELCAYLVGGYVAEIRAYLAKRLPEYMLPSYYISLEQLPLNTNGKLDRHALPEPTQNFSRDAAYIAPRTDLEKKLVSIWEEVLQITNIGIDDNFFSLGGHSLKGIALLARIEKQYHVSLSLRDLFAHPTVQSLGEVIQSTEASIAHSIVPVEERDFYPATSAQQRIYLLQGFEQVGTSYHIPMIMQIEGELDHQRLENALDQLVRRHETLRTTFHLDGDQLVQRVHQQIESKLLVATASSESSARGILEEWIQPFSLDQPPLFRAGLIKLPHHRSLFLLDLHHIIADGASLSIFWSELIDIYQEKELAPLSIQYKDFAVWQQEQLDKGKLKKDQSFWLKQLEQEWPVLQLPTDDPRPPIQQFDGASYFVTFSKELSEAINRLSVELHVTPYMLLLAAYSLLLMKYTEQTDLVIGSPQAGRQQAEVEPLVGMFVNTLPLRLQLNPANSFADWVQQVKEQMIATNEHGDYPIEHLIDQQTVRRDLSRNPLFDTVFSLQNLAFEQKNIPGLHYQPYERAGVTAKFDLSFIMVEEDYFHLSIEYASHLFKEETIARMAAHYQQLLTQIIAAPGRSLHEYSCLTVDEEKQLLAYADGGQQIGSSHQTLVERWERQVEQTPQSIALVDQGRSMTYEELNQRANQLAHRLRREGLQREQLVAIWTQRSLEWVVGILGALKAGGAYLPIDPHYPPERIMYMLKQSQASYLLVSADQSVPESFSGLTLHVDDPTLQQEEQGNPSLINQPHDLAYVIYTSGSTGRPKGVMVEHRAVLNLVQWHQEAYQVTEKDQATQFASVSFDAAVWELFPYLLQGATVHLIPEELRLDLEALHHYYEQTGITISFLPTPLAQRFMERDNRSLRALLVGGDQLRHVKPQSYQIYNNYGPTENTVVSTYCCIDPNQTRLPIGRPIANQQAYVLDEQQRLQPIGVPGELYLGGASLARGYLHDPEQTSAHFIPHPFQPGERLYRTGDRVRWLANGELEYLGRIDDQVSIRGYRVEVAEIEQTLLRHPAVQDGVVIARTEGEQTALAAYLVWANLDEAITLQELRADLLEQLPDYMIPVDWVVLDELPLTPNGKVDRRALPAPTRSDRVERQYIAPRTEDEQRLVQIWEEVLQLSPIGVTDHFFEMGGHSLTAIRLLARIRNEYQIEVPLQVIFTDSTIAGICRFLQQNQQEKEIEITAAPRQEVYPVTSAQKRLYVLHDFAGTAYHIPLVQWLYGSLDLARLEVALQTLVERHEALRTSFQFVEGQLVQQIHPRVTFQLKVHHLRHPEGVEKELQAAIRPFVLENAPLFRAAVYCFPKQKYLLLLDFHHLIADGQSVNLLWKEFVALYRGESLPELSLQYKDYAYWQMNRQAKEGFVEHEKYWSEKLSGEIPMLELPTDAPRPAVQQFTGNVYSWSLPIGLSQSLKQFAKQQGSTLYAVLLAGYVLLLMKETGQEELLVGSPQAGRSQLEMEQIVGMFVNTLPLRVHLQAEGSYLALLKEVSKQLWEDYQHRDYPIEELLAKMGLQHDQSRNPLFDTLFVLQNLEQSEDTLPGLAASPYEWESRTTKFDLTWTAVDAEQITFAIEYASHLFKEETIARMAAHYQQLLTQIVAAPDRSLHEYSCLTVDEEKQLLAYADGGQQIGSSHQTLVERWERQVEQTPQSIALVDQGRSMTYEELNQRANQLAHRLRREGLQREQLVAIWTQRSLEWVVGILGALKAGGAYLPIDPHYPPERIMYMLKQSQARYLLVSANQSVPESFSGLTLHVDDPTLQQEEQGNPSLINQPHDLAYVIYTSGSTGRPKGVMVEHRAVLNLVQWHQEAYQVTEKDQATQFASVSFDAAVWELFPYLLQGATVHLIPEELRLDLEALHHYYEQTGITISFLPTPLAQRFMERDNRSLRALLVGGDQLRHVKPQSYQIYNNYGPTENTVVSTYCCIDPTQHRLPIGRPIANQQAYVLDEQQRLQPIGVPGELYLGGASLARGYLHDPEQTSAHFIPHPFQPGERLYRTGDRVRWLANGELEYLGRIDDQVSIRGYRVEVAEIEQTLLRHPAVQDGVVIARTEGEQTALAAYLVWANLDEAITLQELRADLLEQLPDYMIPVDWMVLDELPLTPNGKVDRRALPMPTRSDRMGQKYVAPRSDQEKLLVEVWQGILPGEQFGIYDHFFEQGGDSIQAMHVVAKLREKYYHISMKDIFQAPTVEQLALRMQQIDKNHLKKEKMVTGEVMLTPIQQWAFELSANIHHWNMGHMLYRAEGWNEQIVEQVWTKIVQHHDGLRMIYQWTDTGVLQRNRAMDEGIYFTLEVIDLRQVREPRERVLAEANRLQQSIRLDQGPLIRLAIFRTNHGDHLLWVIHHLVVDAVSLRILVEDFYTAYGQLLNQQVITLPPVSDSFQTWSRQLAQYANSQELIREIPYWQQLEQLNVLPLPTDFPTTETYAIGEGKIVLMELTSKETNALQSIGYEVQTVLLAALVSVVSEWGVGDRVAILMEGHGRQDILSEIDVTRTVGWFTTLYPMIFQRNASSTQHLLKSINEQLRSVPHQGIGYGLLKYLTKPSLRSALSFQLQPEISFNYLGKMDSYRLDAMPVGYAVDPQTQIKEKIEVNSAITGEGKLVLSFRYSPKAYRQETMERLMQQYREQLLKIIRYANHVTHS